MSLPSDGLRRALLAGILVIALALLAERTWAGYAPYGLFRALGVDFSDYWSQSMALRSGESAGIYDWQVVDGYRARLAPDTSGGSQIIGRLPSPYPPLFAWLFTPFTWPSPPIGFALWTALNVAAAFYLGWRIGALFPRLGWALATLFVLASFPAVWALVNGQPSLLLACVAGEGYLALRRGRDFSAGLWMAGLLFKAQYGLLLGPLLLLKRRWSTVAGALVGGAVLVVGSVLGAGLSALLAYPSVVVQMGSGERNPISAPLAMVNWRALTLRLLPGLSDNLSLTLMLVLGALTILALVPVWRGPWAPRSRRFPAQMTLLWLATLFVNPHSHAHGALLLALPLASLLAEGDLSRVSRVAVLAAAYAPTIYWFIFTFPREYSAGVFPIFTLMLLFCFGSLWIDSVVRPRSDVADSDEAIPSVTPAAVRPV